MLYHTFNHGEIRFQDKISKMKLVARIDDIRTYMRLASQRNLRFFLASDGTTLYICAYSPLERHTFTIEYRGNYRIRLREVGQVLTEEFYYIDNNIIYVGKYGNLKSFEIQKLKKLGYTIVEDFNALLNTIINGTPKTIQLHSLDILLSHTVESRRWIAIHKQNGRIKSLNGSVLYSQRLQAYNYLELKLTEQVLDTKYLKAYLLDRDDDTLVVLIYDDFKIHTLKLTSLEAIHKAKTCLKTKSQMWLNHGEVVEIQTNINTYYHNKAQAKTGFELHEEFLASDNTGIQIETPAYRNYTAGLSEDTFSGVFDGMNSRAQQVRERVANDLLQLERIHRELDNM